MPGGGGEKTEKASPKKREDERKKGNIFMSKDVTTIVTIVVAFFTLQFFVGVFVSLIQINYKEQMENILVYSQRNLVIQDVMELFREGLLLFATTVLPVMLIIGVVTIVVVGAQTKFLLSYEQFNFKMERISFFKGIKKLFSLRSIVELLKSLIKIIVLVWLLYGKVMDTFRLVPIIIDWDIMQAVSYTGQQIMALIISVAIAFGAIAAADYLYQWFEYEKGIRMTKQEVKDEYKQMEGNPEVKSARRQKQREFAMNRMMQQVKEADVIVRNPTHFAVALKYNLDQDAAPRVLAKGKDKIAMKIIEEAEKFDITTVENKPLARSLYELSNIDDSIPAELYQPVAELLAWLYSTKEKGKR